ncbi:hypothetical protein TVAG_083370 [Trichomonas vaginalis G3]|uniref:Uncharacterized protein n=1 Tax=Trichomonas vaginalis (strain ATCC PRA-98 / G3) TaxID=412133 RepID=A2DM64_TRIV3|nr:armadillo (ARM) repeat-containing protein family [Trichomonas vaginalis G3]EAY18484.1 hypothetical protein TVAG_083370 [Trichomonas vaginalis G3]KAI5489527.1 armadillo (ARM) repeat-containing protein family [Trichomonas vaginalis G3]|eukprot:XP_001579470.1 hypothetical protein [Trichomonas vaginalis G3]
MKELFDVLEAYFTNPTGDNLIDEKVWKLLIDIADNDEKHIYLFYDILNKFASISTKFTTESYPCITDKVTALQNQQNSFEEKLKIAKSLCLTFQYIKSDVATEILKQITELASIELNNGAKVPEKVVSLVDLIKADDVMNETLTLYFDYVNTTQTTASIFVFAPLAITILQMVPSSYDATPEIIQKLLNGDDSSIISALFLVDRISDYNYTSEVFENILPFLTYNNDDICRLASRATRSLVGSGIFDSNFIIPAAMDMLEEYKPSNVRYFAKLVNKIIEMDEDFPDLLADTFLNSIESFVKHPEGNFKAAYIDIFCTIASRCPNSATAKSNLAHEAAKELLNTPDYIDIIGAYVIAVIKCIPQFIEDISKNFLPKLISYLDSDVSIKLKLKAAESLAVSAKESKLSPDNFEILFQFVLNSLKIVSGTKVFYACSPVSEILSILSENQAKQAFNGLRNLVLRESGCNETDAVYSVMSLFFENNKVPSSFVFDSVKDIISGNIGYLSGISPVECRDDTTTIFHYISESVKYYPELQKDILTFFLASIKICKEYIFPSVLDILKGITFDDETSKLIFNTLIERVSHLKRNSEDCICSSMEAFFILMQNSPNVFDAQLTVDVISSIVFAESEEEEEILDESYAFAAMVRLFFSICSSSVQFDANHDLFNDYLSLLPFDDSLEGSMIPIYDALSDIIVKQEYSFASLNIARILSDPILLPQKERLEIGIEQSLYDKMRNSLKTAIRSVKGLERNLTKGWSRSNLNRLSSALK